MVMPGPWDGQRPSSLAGGASRTKRMQPGQAHSTADDSS